MSQTFTLEKVAGREAEAAKLHCLTFDLQGEKVNKFSREVMVAFEALLGDLEKRGAAGEVGALVLVSGKPGNFIAGADIELIRAAKTAEEARSLAAQGQALLNRWEDLPFPTAVAIDGAALGGGCELSLASSGILMSNAPAAKIGLPEVLLGIIPGMGGCVRLPRKVGLATALDMILTGKTLSGDRALKAGLIEACLPQEGFKESALKWMAIHAKELKEGKRLARPPKLGGMGGAAGSLLEGNFAGRRFILSKARQGVVEKTRGKYPAPLEAIAVLKDNGAAFGAKLKGGSRDRALAREAAGFGRAAATEVSKNLIRLFFLTEGVKKSKGVEPGVQAEARVVKQAAVLGAGVMGGGIAQLFAERGLPTRMKDLNAQALAAGLVTASGIFKKQLQRRRINPRQMAQKMNLIAPVTDYSGFKSVDVVVEAIIEKLDIKCKVLGELEGYVRDDAVLASNTSSLSISAMQKALKHPERFVGMHFFNPVAKMPLVEVIKGEKSSDDAVATIYQFCKAIGKTPVVVRDTPGFLVNRLLMPYLNESTYLLAEGAPIEELDEALLDFGMPMGPMELIDEVGVDVGVKVAHILHDAFGARMLPSPMNEKVAASGRLGKKNGKGLYVYEGRKKTLSPEIYSILGVTPQRGSVTRVEMVDRCILPMINEGARCLDEGVVASVAEADLGMIMGTGFPPFKGGLFRYADSVGVKELVERMKKYQVRFGARFEPSEAILKRAANDQPFYVD